MATGKRHVRVELTDEDIEHATEMDNETTTDDSASEGEDTYDYYADDLAYDAARERGYR